MSNETSTGSPVSTRMRLWVVVCVLGVFGPYIVSGARTEQLVIYGSAVAIGATQLPRLGKLLRPAALILGLWAAYSLLVVVDGLLLSNHMPWPSGSLVAGVDNALLPLATIFTFVYFTWTMGSDSLLRLVSWTLAWAMAANALLAVVSAYLGLGALPGLGRFWSSGGYDASVAVLAEQMGRFSGVFNQPAEAGVAYSLAVLAVVFLVRTEEEAPRWVLYTLMSLLVVGGLLTLSKVFAVGGLFLALVLALLDPHHRRRTVAVGGLVVVAVGVLGVLNLAGSWGASIMLSWYRGSFSAGDSLAYTLSAGRFGTPSTTGPPTIAPVLPSAPSATDGAGAPAGAPTSPGDGTTDAVPLPSGVGDIFRQIFEHQPILGVGARGLDIAYDSTWGESLVVGGIVGLTLMALIHLALVARWFSARRTQPRATWFFGATVVLLALGGSFGLPALTGNRESTLLWMFLVPLVVVAQCAPEAGRHRVGATDGTVLDRRQVSTSEAF